MHEHALSQNRLKLQPYRGRITVYCIAETLDRRSLITLLATSFPAYTVTQYSDVVHVEVPDAANQPGMSADAFFFEVSHTCGLLS